MRTVDGRVIKIKGNRREEAAQKRKNMAMVLVYVFLFVMIIALCGVLVYWMFFAKENDAGKNKGSQELPQTGNMQDPSIDNMDVFSTAAAGNATSNIDVSGMLQDFHVVSGNGGSGGAVHPDKYALFGRWYQKEIDGVLCNNTVTQGAMVFFKVQGTTSINIKFVVKTMMETPYYAYSIDGSEMQRKLVTDGQVVLPDTAEHEVCLIMDGMSEREFKWSGEVGFAFSDIDCGEGMMTSYIPAKKSIMLLGDSLTEGIMTLGGESLSQFNSASHSYGWYLAKALDANPYFSAYGSIGITETGSFNTVSGTLDYLSETKKISEEMYPNADMIIVNVGTNDFAAMDPDFYSGYCDVLKKLKSRYPTSVVLCVVPYNQTHADQVRQAAEKQGAFVIETADWELSYSDADGLHPDNASSQYIAQKIAEFISQNIQF